MSVGEPAILGSPASWRWKTPSSTATLCTILSFPWCTFLTDDRRIPATRGRFSGNDVRSRRNERSQDRFNRRSTVHTLHPYAKRQHSRVSQNPSTLKFRPTLGRIFALDSPTKSSRVSFRPAAAGPLRSNESSCAFRTRQRDRRSTFRRNFCFQRCTVIVIPADRPQSSFQRSLLHHGNLLRLPPYCPSLRTCHPWILVETIFLSNRFSRDYQRTRTRKRSDPTIRTRVRPIPRHSGTTVFAVERLPYRLVHGPRLALCCQNESAPKRVHSETSPLRNKRGALSDARNGISHARNAVGRLGRDTITAS